MFVAGKIISGPDRGISLSSRIGCPGNIQRSEPFQLLTSTFIGSPCHLHSIHIMRFFCGSSVPVKIKFNQIRNTLSPRRRLIHIVPKTIDAHICIKAKLFAPPLTCLRIRKIREMGFSRPYITRILFSIGVFYK